MGSVFRRKWTETGKAEGWFVKAKDTDGKWHLWDSKQTTKADAKVVLAEGEARVRRGLPFWPEPVVPPAAEMTFGELAEQWAAGLTNRSAREDRYSLKNHLKPALGTLPLSAVTMERLMRWLDTQRAAEDPLSDGTIRRNLNLVSRVFSYGIERGLVPSKVNPVRQIPQGRRPTERARRDLPWLNDDALVRRLINTLPEPFGLMFYLGSQSGLRTGELCGLRLSDLAYLDAGTVRVRFSYDDCLKEDKFREGKVKWAPAGADAKAVLGPWLAKREAEGAGPEDFVFVNAKSRQSPGGLMFRKAALEHAFNATRDALKSPDGKPVLPPGLTWYAATRHSFVSRNLSRGASMDEVSAAVGHANITTTRRYYDHFERKTFSPTLTAGLGLGSPKDADVVPLKGRKGKVGR